MMARVGTLGSPYRYVHFDHAYLKPCIMAYDGTPIVATEFKIKATSKDLTIQQFEELMRTKLWEIIASAIDKACKELAEGMTIQDVIITYRYGIPVKIESHLNSDGFLENTFSVTPRIKPIEEPKIQVIGV